jgi:DNA end-binding protein Ku
LRPGRRRGILPWSGVAAYPQEEVGTMPRAIWNGAISFGLVNVPVKLYNAVSKRDVRFNQLHAPDGSRIQMRRFCASEGTEVPTDEIVRGYEVAKGQYVVVSDEEIEAARPEGTHQIAIEEFADLAEIDPLVYDASYYAAPERAAVRAYALLRDAMLDANRVGIGRFALRTRESVCAVRATPSGLVVSTLAYADEVVSPESIPEIAELSVEASEKERAMAVMLIDSMTDALDLSKYRDTFRDAILEVIQRKAAGETIAAPQPQATAEAPVGDIMAALEASLAAAKEREPAKKPTRRSKATTG